MKASPIPTTSRVLVKARDGGRCVRCGSGNSPHWHHRRSRRVRDEHTHSPSNGVLLCGTCHTWVHGHPTAAMELGYILPATVTKPWLHQVMHVQWGWVLLDNQGALALQPERKREAR